MTWHFNKTRDHGNVMLPHTVFLFELDFIFLSSDVGHNRLISHQKQTQRQHSPKMMAAEQDENKKERDEGS